MKRSLLSALAVMAFMVMVPVVVHSQSGYNSSGYGYEMGPGMMGGYGGHGMGYGMMGSGEWEDVPSKLPTPKNNEWVQQLQELLVMEKDSLAQYQADQEKFNAYMPYMMVIPQEEVHVQWIEKLFEAYSLKYQERIYSIVSSKSLTDAYELSIKMEKDLLPRYEWLVKNAEDQATANILDTALIQSRIHLTMFDHALRVGTGYGFGMRRGFGRGYGMGSGMMGGYGYDMGPGMMGGYGYGNDQQRYQRSEKPINLKEATTMMNDYLKSTKNPHLKVGKIKDIGNAFEAELLTKENSVVDKIHINKSTGWMRSAYR